VLNSERLVPGECSCVFASALEGYNTCTVPLHIDLYARRRRHDVTLLINNHSSVNPRPIPNAKNSSKDPTSVPKASEPTGSTRFLRKLMYLPIRYHLRSFLRSLKQTLCATCYEALLRTFQGATSVPFSAAVSESLL
jgi:hypothetical protein